MYIIFTYIYIYILHIHTDIIITDSCRAQNKLIPAAKYQFILQLDDTDVKGGLYINIGLLDRDKIIHWTFLLLGIIWELSAWFLNTLPTIQKN